MTSHITENGGTFPCPLCQSLHPCAVVDSRVVERYETYRRRRACRGCGRRFTTYEYAEVPALPQITKRDGRTAPFDRNKLYLSMLRASGKHPSEEVRADAERIADEIAASVTESAEAVSSPWLRDRVERALRGPARVRYASFGMTLTDLGAYCHRLMGAHRAAR